MRVNKLFKCIPDRLYLSLMYFYHFHRFPDLNNPKTFNEKMQYLKLNDRNSKYIDMVDKLAMKDYVSNIVGEQYVVPVIDSWTSPNDIVFESLPNQFVLKCNHDSGSVYICNNKNTFNRNEAVVSLNKNLLRSGFDYGREWPYKHVVPKVFAEQYIQNENMLGAQDYKVYCFNGSPKYILVCSNRFDKNLFTEDYYDTDWNHLNIRRPNINTSDSEHAKPKNLDEILSLAKSLSKGIPFLRVDFFEDNDRLYVGELTFYPASGFLPFIPAKWDKIMGQLINV